MDATPRARHPAEKAPVSGIHEDTRGNSLRFTVGTSGAVPSRLTRKGERSP